MGLSESLWVNTEGGRSRESMEATHTHTHTSTTLFFSSTWLLPSCVLYNNPVLTEIKMATHLRKSLFIVLLRTMAQRVNLSVCSDRLHQSPPFRDILNIFLQQGVGARKTLS